MNINATQFGQRPNITARRGLRAHLIGTAAVALGLMAVSGSAHAEAPLAGTIIGNQAIATFNDGTQTRSVTSNLVQTEINQVFAVDIEAAQTKAASVDGLVSFPHTITNTGNGSDSFSLATAEGGTGNFDGIIIYADANCDGVPDSATPLSATPSLGAGESFCVVVEADVSSTVADGDPANFGITATSVGGTAVSDTNNDVINVTSGPILGVTKSVVLANDLDMSGSITPGDTLTFRLTYSNNQPGTNATAYIVDDLSLPNSPVGANADFVGMPTNFVWSDGFTLNASDDGFTQNTPSGIGGAFTTSDATNASSEQIDVFYTGTEVQIGVDINSGALARQGFVEFDVVVGSDASGTPVNVATIDTVPSNEVPIAISRDDTIALVLNDVASAPTAYADRSLTDGPDADGSWNAGTTPASASATDSDATVGNDIIAFGPTVAEGAVVPFQVILTNHSNTEERFNLTAALDGSGFASAGGDQFPAGTTFTFYTAGGSPLLDVDGNGIPDVLIAANTAIAFEVRADLPLGFTADTPAPSGNGGTDPIPAALVTATSSTNLAVTNSTVIQLAGGVQGASVDLQNDGPVAVAVAGSPDADLDNSGSPWTTETVNPGNTATFDLIVQNTSLAPDSYNLSFSDANPFTIGTLPADWTVVFRNASGAIVTNTGIIAVGSSVNFTANVTVPAGQAPIDQGVYFRATSATNNSVTDTKLDQVTVNTVADLAITPDRQGQVAAGGSLILSHTLTNVGNVPVDTGSLDYTNFSSLIGQIYLDDGDGVFELNGDDDVIDNIGDITGGLAAGESVTIFNQVQASASAVAGLSESATISVGSALTSGSDSVTDANSNNNTVTDIVTIVSGDLEVLKLQALDEDCNGADGPLQTQLIQADPGACIVYQVTAENTGTANATDVRIIDTTPAFTTQSGSAAALGGTPTIISQPGDGVAGDVTSGHSTLAPGAVATLTFSVQIDQ
jgi:uncharacterized repeat protein (TIGR01451 family)